MYLILKSVTEGFKIAGESGLVVVAVFFNVVVVMQPYGNWVQIGKFQAINICKEN